MDNRTNEELKNFQKDRMTVKSQEVKFLSKEEFEKMNIKFYDKKSKKED